MMDFVFASHLVKKSVGRKSPGRPTGQKLDKSTAKIYWGIGLEGSRLTTLLHSCRDSLIQHIACVVLEKKNRN